jgi:hypothetical protein
MMATRASGMRSVEEGPWATARLVKADSASRRFFIGRM